MSPAETAAALARIKARSEKVHALLQFEIAMRALAPQLDQAEQLALAELAVRHRARLGLPAKLCGPASKSGPAFPPLHVVTDDELVDDLTVSDGDDPFGVA